MYNAISLTVQLLCLYKHLDSTAHLHLTTTLDQTLDTINKLLEIVGGERIEAGADDPEELCRTAKETIVKKVVTLLT